MLRGSLGRVNVRLEIRVQTRSFADVESVLCAVVSADLIPPECSARALKLSKVRPFVLYSLRHTFLTRLGASGCDVWTLARIAGHSSVAISARYVHPSEDSVLAAVEKLAGHNSRHREEEPEGTHSLSKLLSARSQ